MTTPTLHAVSDVPPACQHAREVVGLRLAGDTVIDAAADAHVQSCSPCATVTARMARVWQVAGEVLPARAIPAARLDAILNDVLAGARSEEKAPVSGTAPAPARILPTRERRSSHEGFAFATGLALAATIAAVALLGPGLVAPPAGDPLARATVAPPAGPPRVSLAAARGEVSHVPADGSVIGVPKAGDVLPPGLFAASEGAALSIEGEGLLAVRGEASVVVGGNAGAPEIFIARGEIFVDLPKGTIRTFVVRTPTGAVHVTGTQFDVKVKAGETAVEVTRGSVIVKGPGGERAVSGGEAAVLRDGIPVEGLVTSPAADPHGWVRDLAPERVGPAPAIAIAPRPVPAAPEAGLPKADDGVIHVAGLDKLVVENAMEKREAAIRYCYEQALVKAPELVVRAALRFRIDEDGRAKDITIAGLPAGQQKLGGCLETAAKAAIFPPTVPGTEVTVSYPLKLEPAAE